MLSDRPANILVVDDQAENLMVLEAVLADPGYHIVRARSGRDALKCLLEQDFEYNQTNVLRHSSFIMCNTNRHLRLADIVIIHN